MSSNNKADEKTKFFYHTIAQITPSNKINYFGIIKYVSEIKTSVKKDFYVSLSIVDDSFPVAQLEQKKVKCNLFSKDEKIISHFRVGFIIRIHRMKFKIINGQLNGDFYLGCSWALFSSDMDQSFDVLHTSTPNHTPLDKDSIDKITNLRKWYYENKDYFVEQNLRFSTNLIKSIGSMKTSLMKEAEMNISKPVNNSEANVDNGAAGNSSVLCNEYVEMGFLNAVNILATNSKDKNSLAISTLATNVDVNKPSCLYNDGAEMGILMAVDNETSSNYENHIRFTELSKPCDVIIDNVSIFNNIAEEGLLNVINDGITNDNADLFNFASSTMITNEKDSSDPDKHINKMWIAKVQDLSFIPEDSSVNLEQYEHNEDNNSNQVEDFLINSNEKHTFNVANLKNIESFSNKDIICPDTIINQLDNRDISESSKSSSLEVISQPDFFNEKYVDKLIPYSEIDQFLLFEPFVSLKKLLQKQPPFLYKTMAVISEICPSLEDPTNLVKMRCPNCQAIFNYPDKNDTDSIDEGISRSSSNSDSDNANNRPLIINDWIVCPFCTDINEYVLLETIYRFELILKDTNYEMKCTMCDEMTTKFFGGLRALEIITATDKAMKVISLLEDLIKKEIELNVAIQGYYNPTAKKITYRIVNTKLNP